jgi:hypothetical protein
MLLFLCFLYSFGDVGADTAEGGDYLCGVVV